MQLQIYEFIHVTNESAKLSAVRTSLKCLVPYAFSCLTGLLPYLPDLPCAYCARVLYVLVLHLPFTLGAFAYLAPQFFQLSHIRQTLMRLMSRSSFVSGLSFWLVFQILEFLQHGLRLFAMI